MNDLSYMARFGARLVTNGYGILPIGPGTKKPGQFKRGAWLITRNGTGMQSAQPQRSRLRRGRRGPIAALGLLAVQLLQSISISWTVPISRCGLNSWHATGWETPKPYGSERHRSAC